MEIEIRKHKAGRKYVWSLHQMRSSRESKWVSKSKGFQTSIMNRKPPTVDVGEM